MEACCRLLTQRKRQNHARGSPRGAKYLSHTLTVHVYSLVVSKSFSEARFSRAKQPQQQRQHDEKTKVLAKSEGNNLDYCVGHARGELGWLPAPCGMDGRVSVGDRRENPTDVRPKLGFAATLGPMPPTGVAAPRREVVPSIGNGIGRETRDTTTSPPVACDNAHQPTASTSTSSDAPNERLRRELNATKHELVDATAVALSGMESHAELVWARRDLAAQREAAVRWQKETTARTRESSEKDDRIRERLRKLGLWRLMGRLGLDMSLQNNSRLAMKTWLDAVRRRARMEGGLVTHTTPDRKYASKGNTRTDSEKQNPDDHENPLSDDPDSDSDDGEPGPRRWRSCTKRKQTTEKISAFNDPDLASRRSSMVDDDDAESVVSYSTLASTEFDGGGNDDKSSVVSEDEGHGLRFLELKGSKNKKKHSYSTAPTAAPGLRHADLARLAMSVPPSGPIGGVGSEAVLAWRERASAAAADLEAMSAAKFAAEEELRARRRVERATTSKTAEQEEVLRGEIETLRCSIAAGEQRHATRLASAAEQHELNVKSETAWREKLAVQLCEAQASREEAEGTLRELQRSTRDSAVLAARRVEEDAVAETETKRALALERDIESLRFEAETRETTWREKLTAETTARDDLEKAHVTLRETQRATNEELEQTRDAAVRAAQALEKELNAARVERDAAELAAREATNTSRAHHDEVSELSKTRERDLETRLLESRRKMLASDIAWRERLAEAENRAAAAAATAEARERELADASREAALQREAAVAATAAIAMARETAAAAAAKAASAREAAAEAEAAVSLASSSAFSSRTVAERLALESAAAEARASSEQRESSSREALDAERKLRADAESSLRDTTQTSRARETGLEEALHEARENTRAASEARADAANALAAKERELADVAALRAAAAEEATRARLAEYALSERLADVSTSAKVTQAERDDLSGELVTLKETHDTLSGGFQKLRDENETLIRVQNETSRRDAALLQQHKEKLEAKEREFVELKRLRDEADANAETWKRRVERTEAELQEMSVSTARATDERRHAMDAEARAVSLLETKLSSLDSTLSKQVESLQTRLNNAQSALAKAEAKMLVMARDLAEAEEELETRDALAAEEGRRVASTKETSQVRLIETRQGMNDAVPVVETSSTGVSDHPIFSKTRNNRHVEVERMLKALAFDPNVRDKHGNTVLAVAAQNNRKRLVKAAVRAGVRLDAQNEKGNTAAHFACAYGYEDISEYLVKKGADPGILNGEGKRPDQGL